MNTLDIISPMARRGMTITEIEKNTGIKYQTIYSCLKKYNIEVTKTSTTGGRPIGSYDKKPRTRRKKLIEGGNPVGDIDDVDFIEKIKASIAETDKCIIDSGHGNFIKPII